MDKYKTSVAQYIVNTKNCVKYRRNVDAKNLDKSTYIAKFIKNNQVLHQMLKLNNQLLDYLFFSRKDIYTMSDEDYHYLDYFVNQLKKELADVESNLIFEIYTVLLHYAHVNLSLDEQIKNEYFVSYYSYSTQLDLIPYFKTTYKAYNSINSTTYFQLQKQSRNYYCRIKLNRYTSLRPSTSEEIDSKINNIKELIDFVDDSKVRAKDPDFDFDDWKHNALINLNSVFNALYDGVKLSENNQKILNDLYTNYDLSYQFHSDYNRVNYLTSFYSLQFHMDKIDLKTLLQLFDELIDQFQYCDDQMRLAIFLRIQWIKIAYLRAYTNDSNQAKGCLNTAMRIMDVKQDVLNGPLFDGLYHAILKEGCRIKGFDAYKEELFDTLVLRHSATYIHAMMVKEISLILFAQYCKKNPMIDYEEYVSIIKDCALFHDIGKARILPIVRLNHRQLTACEFAQIKLHPEFGNIFIKDMQINPYLSECITFHHKSYDGHSGYPNIVNINHSFVVDIIKVADSLDAASDHIGRPYSDTKDLNQIYLELKSYAGSIYSADIIELLDDPYFLNQLAQTIKSKREALYYKKYLNDAA